MYILNGSSRVTLKGNNAGQDYYLVNMENNTTVMLTNSLGYRREEVDGKEHEVADTALDQSLLTFTGVTYSDMLKVSELGKDAIANNAKIFAGIVAGASKESQLVNLSDMALTKPRAPVKAAKEPVNPPQEVVDEAKA